VAIDRRTLVRRHNPVLTSAHPTGVLSVGNGDAALSVDITGLQSLPDFHEIKPDPLRVVGDGLSGLPQHRARDFNPDDFQIPLRTQTTWGWYEARGVRDFAMSETITHYETRRGPVPYPDKMGLQRAADPIAEEFQAGAWFHYNPRRAHLGRLALVNPAEAKRLEPSDISDARTELDLWSGVVHATYTLAGERVTVSTVADPDGARFAVRVESTLLARGWAVAWIFDPQPDDLAPFELPLRERTTWRSEGTGVLTAMHEVESMSYSVTLETSGRLSTSGERTALATTREGSLDVVATLNPAESVISREATGYDHVRAAAETWWQEYWERGATISLDGSDDPRAPELERRIVLSQYLLAVNCAGETPPAESGLTYNTWTGKFHLEMHWWHAAQFPMWGRGHLLERSIEFYHQVIDRARETARSQGYDGARWPKQTDPSGRESPSNIGVFLVWQQPHIIYLLELLWSEGRDEEFLRRHYPLVQATAEFMSDFVEERDGAFILPAPLVPAQESYLAYRASTENPTFELAYWAWALTIANSWRERLGLEPAADWERVARGMTPPATLPDGTYAAVSTEPFLIRQDHPSMLMALGWVPDAGLVDRDVMANTLRSVKDSWEQQSTWGWDYPVLAMTAAHLGDTAGAIDALLMPSPKNVFLANGHNPQIPGFLSIYLPANGGLLAAMAHILESVRAGSAPPVGFHLNAEGLRPLPKAPAAALGRR
jgi:hypothetical protein